MNKRCQFLFINVFIMIFLSSCQQLSEAAIQKAIDQTQSILPTSTNTSAPTTTATNTPEPTFTLTATITPTFTLTPDVRIIAIGPEQFLLEKGDLPADAKYYVPNQLWISPDHNDEVIGRMGENDGGKYLRETGRIDGWYIFFKRGSSRVPAPKELSHRISQFESCEGALIAVEKYTAYKIDNKYEMVDDDYDLGDKTVISKYRELQPGGEYIVRYYVETAYRNYVSQILAYGYEEKFDLEYVIQIAEIALELLADAPLVEP